MLKVLAAIQVRSRGEWRNLPYFAISQVFRHREVPRQPRSQSSSAILDMTSSVKASSDDSDSANRPGYEAGPEGLSE